MNSQTKFISQHPVKRWVKDGTQMIEPIYDDNKIKLLYEKVIEAPNKDSPSKKGFIKCPICGEEILMIPTLRVMGEAIENHVHKHKQELINDPIKAHKTAIIVRLDLLGQVLQQACQIHVS
jgi:hypothetical protein